MQKAIAREVACAVHATIHRITNTKQILMTPIWPITTLEGRLERVFAAFITDGPKNEEPRPAKVKEAERIIMTNVSFDVPMRVTATIPTKKDSPESIAARTTNISIEK